MRLELVDVLMRGEESDDELIDLTRVEIREGFQEEVRHELTDVGHVVWEGVRIRILLQRRKAKQSGQHTITRARSPSYSLKRIAL
jgi:hypothetical protein